MTFTMKLGGQGSEDGTLQLKLVDFWTSYEDRSRSHFQNSVSFSEYYMMDKIQKSSSFKLGGTHNEW